MALTKVTGQVIKNTTDVTVGVLTVTNTLAVGGTVSIGGTLTYEDVTNVDAVGLVTARNGIVVGSGITLSKDGDGFFTGIVTATTFSGSLAASNLTGALPAISGANLTNLDASDLASGTVPTARLGSGTASSSTFLRGDSTFAAVTSTTINNNADNRLITGSGTANTLEAESGLTFDGTQLQIGGDSTVSGTFGLEIYNTDSNEGTALIAGDAGARLDIMDTGSSERLRISASGAIYFISYKNGDDIIFQTTNGSGTGERLRITSDGEFLIGRTSTPNDINKLVVTGTSPADVYDNTLYLEGSETSGAIDTGGALGFGGHDGTSFRNWANIYGMKENGTSGNTAAYMAFHTRAAGGNPTERLRIQSDGDVVIGDTDADAKLHVHSSNHYVLTSSGVAHRHIHCSAVNGNAGEYGGAISFGMGSTGAAAVAGVQGAADADNVGLAFITHNSGTGSADATEMMRITSAGLVAVGDAISGMDMGFGQQLFSSKSGTYSASILGSTSSSVTTSIIYNSNTSLGGTTSMCDWRAAASNSSAWYFLRCSSSSASDNEFFLAGDGNAYADGSWSGGGADYAEYFEWSDGNTSDEDRRGMTVVLDGTKIKIATSSDSTDNIIGVVSGNPSMIGDAAYCKWTGKYQRDDYNSYVRDSNGARVLNSDYDDTKIYLPRKDRKEWDAIGMVGKLRVRKGQQTGTRWIKMKDVSDTIEEWLVR